MEYVYLFIAVMCIGGQFCMTKIFQNRVGNGLITSLLFSLFSAIVASIIFACLCKFNISTNLFVLLTSGGVTLCLVGYTIVGIKMMSIGKVAVYSLFLMLGGMFVPFVYGVIFLNEPLSVWKVIGMVLVITALILQALKKTDEVNKNNKLLIIFGIIIFIFNGMTGVFAKMHQISQNAVSSLEFSFFQNAIGAVTIVLTLAICAMLKKGSEIQEDIKKVLPNWWIILLFAIISQTGGLLILITAKTMDASVEYPFVTSGVLIVSAIVGRIFFKEKIDRLVFISLVLSVISVVLFMF